MRHVPARTAAQEVAALVGRAEGKVGEDAAAGDASKH
jgi:hypothetical protein